MLVFFTQSCLVPCPLQLLQICFLFLQSPFIGDEGDELPIFCWNSSLCGWNQPKYPPLRTHEGWTPYFSSENWFIGLKFVFLPPKRCRKVAQTWKTMGKIIELPSWWHTFLAFQVRRGANAGAAWSGAPVGSRWWSWWLMVTTGYHWNFTMISWRFNWNFTTK